MKHLTLIMAISAAFASARAADASKVQAPVMDPKPAQLAKSDTLEGTVFWVNLQNSIIDFMVAPTSSGVNFCYRESIGINDTTTITLNGKAAALSALKEGDLIAVRFDHKVDGTDNPIKFPTSIKATRKQ